TSSASPRASAELPSAGVGGNSPRAGCLGRLPTTTGLRPAVPLPHGGGSGWPQPLPLGGGGAPLAGVGGDLPHARRLAEELTLTAPPGGPWGRGRRRSRGRRAGRRERTGARGPPL